LYRRNRKTTSQIFNPGTAKLMIDKILIVEPKNPSYVNGDITNQSIREGDETTQTIE